MSGFARGLRLGTGLMSLGWGACRLARGKRDMLTAALTMTGVSLAYRGATGERPPLLLTGAEMVAARAMPGSFGMVRKAPQVLAKSAEMISNALMR